MADRAGREPEVLYCHVCHNDWNRAANNHDLECPECHSDFVEVIDEGSDLRNSTPDEEDDEIPPRRTTPNPSNHHSTWIHDPDDGDFHRVEWNAGPNVQFFQASVRSSSSGIGSPGQRMNDPFAAFFQSVSTVMEGPTAAPRPLHFNGIPGPPGRSRQHESDPSMPRLQNHIFHHEHWHPSPGSTLGSPLREGSPITGGSRHTYTRLRPRDANNAQPQTEIVDPLQRVLGQLLHSMHGMNQTGPIGTNMGGPNSPLHLFAQLLNPANAAHGDAVYTEEALDRVITQFMEQANGTSAPGPASAEAISRLPKKEADKSMMGNDGKAECSVCMDNVDIGDEVTVLPCGHWFHGDCVGAWLKEHDTCPHCRQGIMPKDATSPPANASRSPRQSSRVVRDFSTDRSPGGPWQSETPRIFHEHHLRSNDHHRRRSSAREGRNGGEGSSGGGGGGGGGGLSGWVRDRFGRGNNDRN